MRIGYACVNTRLECRGPHALDVASGASEPLRDTVRENLGRLARVLLFNLENGLLLFRISSDLIPFASQADAGFSWQREFEPQFRELGDLVQRTGMRVSMHPDQFTVLNAQDEGIVARSIGELCYHAGVLDACGLDRSHKIQIHVGGIYGDKPASIRRFIERYHALPEAVRTRLAIENDDRFFDLSDCIGIHAETGMPVVFDTLHHSLNNDGTTVREGVSRALATWRNDHGPLMVDYSTQDPARRPGCHASTIDSAHFRRFLEKTTDLDFDILCEIKDKEASALKALAAARHLGRVANTTPTSSLPRRT